MRKYILLCLTLSIIVSLVSCGSETDSTENVEVTTADTTAQLETEYTFAELDLGGADFTMLNPTTIWGFYTDIDFDEATGESLDDAIFERNSKLEELYNFNLVVVEEDIDSMTTLLTNSIMVGDDQYQVAFPRCTTISALITDGSLYDLNSIPELRLDKPWWDQNAIAVSSLGSERLLYFAATDFVLTGFDGTMCVFFNEDMLSELGGESPYQLVRDGSWTLDELYSLMQLGASLNGDSSFAWNANNSATYGLTGYSLATCALLFGSEAEYISLDDNGYPVIGFESERFINAAEKIGQMFSNAGEWLDLNINQEADHCETAFKNSRALMLITELKASSKFRDMNDTFGILPIPKYDTAQEQYRTYRSPVNPVMCIPVTNPNASDAALIMDAFSYMTYSDVLPTYYDVNLSQKGLRNEDSIDMLNIIRDTRYFDVSQCYGWTNTLFSEIQNQLNVGNGAVASTIAKYKDSILASIDKTLELLGE